MGFEHELKTAKYLESHNPDDPQHSGKSKQQPAKSTTARIDRTFRHLSLLVGVCCFLLVGFFLYRHRETIFPSDPDKRRENVIDAMLWAADQDVTVQELKEKQRRLEDDNPMHKLP